MCMWTCMCVLYVGMYVSMCMCVYVCTCMWACMWVCMWGLCCESLLPVPDHFAPLRSAILYVCTHLELHIPLYVHSLNFSNVHVPFLPADVILCLTKHECVCLLCLLMLCVHVCHVHHNFTCLLLTCSIFLLTRTWIILTARG